MALDLLLEKRFGGETPRRYRHEAESFAWSLICLYFATAEGKDGKSYTRNPHPLRRWFEDWEISRNAKFALAWHDSDISGISLAYPNTRQLACTLHKYWVDRYTRQFPHPYKEDDVPSLIAEILGIAVSKTEDPPPYEEPEDDRVFQEVLVKHERALYVEPLREVWDDLVKMGLECKETY